MDDLEAKWLRVQERMRDERGDAEYRVWVTELVLVGRTEGTIVLSAPTRFVRDWTVYHYQKLLLSFWKKEDAQIERVTCIIRSSQK